MGEYGIGFIVDVDVFLEQLGVCLLLGNIEQAERVVPVGTETRHRGEDPASQHMMIIIINH